ANEPKRKKKRMENKINPPPWGDLPLKVFQTRRRKGYWVCPENGARDPRVQKVLYNYVRNLIWNRYRSCWVLPNDEGEAFYHKYFDDHDNHALQAEEDDLKIFPMEQRDFVPEHEFVRARGAGGGGAGGQGHEGGAEGKGGGRQEQKVG